MVNTGQKVSESTDLRLTIFSKSRLPDSEYVGFMEFSIAADLSKAKPPPGVKATRGGGSAATIIALMFVACLLALAAAVYYFMFVKRKIVSDPVIMVDNMSQFDFEKDGAPSL